MYDRRLAVYREAQELLGKIQRDAQIGFDDAIKFRRNTVEADFLFAADVQDYLKQLFDKAIDLQTEHGRHSDRFNTPETERQHALARKHEALKWLVSQGDPLKEKFHGYMHFPD